MFIDDVYLDGEKLPRSTLSPPGIALSALIDTVRDLSLGLWHALNLRGTGKLSSPRPDRRHPVNPRQNWDTIPVFSAALACLSNWWQDIPR